MKSYKFLIIGRVQGVYYRKNICDNALNSKFSGYVKNLSDGSVEAAVSCEESRVDDFIEILKKGSQSSRVDSVKQFSTDDIYEGTFRIVY